MRNLHEIPLFMHPTTVLFVDDEESFTNSILLGLDPDKNKYKVFNDPERALVFISEKKKPDSFCAGIKLKESFNNSNSLLELSITDLYKEIYNHRRYEEISVVVVDYNMPYLNGIDFCKKIKNPDVVKVLLTGFAEEEKAIDAFNDGVIDFYFKKGDLDNNKLESIINKVTKKYFLNLSNKIFDLIKLSEFDYFFNKNDITAKTFENVLIEKNIKEYYTFNLDFACLTIDKDSVLGNLYIRDKSYMDFVNKEMVDLELNQDAPLILANKKMLCFPFGLSGVFSKTERIDKFYFNCEKIKEPDVFCAFTPNFLDIEESRLSIS